MKHSKDNYKSIIKKNMAEKNFSLKNFYFSKEVLSNFLPYFTIWPVGHLPNPKFLQPIH